MGRLRLKQRARATMLQPRRPNLFLVTLLYTLIAMVLGTIVTNLSDWGQYEMELLGSLYDWAEAYLAFDTESGFVLPALTITATGVFFFVAGYVLRWMMDLGYVYYARGAVRGEQVNTRSLFEGFNYFFKGLAVRLIYSVGYLVLTLLLVVPGWIFMCTYSQVFLLLLDNPDKGVFWFFRESRRLMRGRKWDYFVLRLSFIGWELLQMLPYIRYIAYMWAVPYVEVTMVHYYNELTGQVTPDDSSGWERPGMF